MDLQQLLDAVQAGGNTALMAACYFIYRAAGRLSRIEAMLELVLMGRGIDAAKVQESDHE